MITQANTKNTIQQIPTTKGAYYGLPPHYKQTKNNNVMNIFKSLTLTFLMTLFSGALFSQGVVKGIIQDKETNETLIGATVMVKGSTNGITTDLDGAFSFKVPAGKSILEFSYMGYTGIEKAITLKDGQTLDLGIVQLASSSIGLDEVSILADVAIDRKTPVAVSTIKSEIIEKNLGSQEFPEILKNTPSVYPTKSGGGFGDASINVRGFDQRNIGVLVNGIPVNDMENGWVYWSNWAGLGDATRTVQVQRGLGASKLAINSVGGTINIITKTSDMKKGGSMKVEMSDFGRKKATLSLSTGNMESGTAITFVGSRTTGPGYIDATYTDAWSYFLSASQQINKDHQLVFTLIGAPQKHGQRDRYNMLTQEEYDQYGTKLNKNWGYLYGEKLNTRNNFYHKPQAALNWYWTINEKSFLSTSAYASVGTGGGSGGLGKGDFYYDPERTKYEFQYDWNFMIDTNSRADDGSVYILRNSVNNHFWYGALSTFTHHLNENFTVMAGIDARYYKGEHYREVRDLLGGAYWADKNNPKAKVGDIVAYNNDGIVKYGGAFGQLEYASGNLAAFVAGTISNTWNQRVDYYNYNPGIGEKSEVLSDLGYNGKVGVNYNLSETSNVFVNGGYYSRVPNFQFMFLNYKNDVNEERENEKVLAAEAGYGFKNKLISVHANVYYTVWQDINKISKFGRKNIYYYGLEETHYGAELEVHAKPIKNLNVGLTAAYGEWTYNNSVNVVDRDENDPSIVDEYTVDLKDVSVYDQPQTQVSLFADYKIKNFDFGANWNFYDRLYAAFNIKQRTLSPDDLATPEEERVPFGNSYQLPSYNTLDLRAGWNFKIAGLDAYASAQCFNVLDTEAIVSAEEDIEFEDNSYKHNFNKGFWTWNRNFNFSLKVSF